MLRSLNSFSSLLEAIVEDPLLIHFFPISPAFDDFIRRLRWWHTTVTIRKHFSSLSVDAKHGGDSAIPCFALSREQLEFGNWASGCLRTRGGKEQAENRNDGKQQFFFHAGILAYGAYGWLGSWSIRGLRVTPSLWQSARWQGALACGRLWEWTNFQNRSANSVRMRHGTLSRRHSS